MLHPVISDAAGLTNVTLPCRSSPNIPSPITTTAVKLHPENETRLLSLTVTDTQEQTRAVMAALAQEASETGPNFEPWHALQVWLESAEHRVWIPYAKQLTVLIPPVAVRLRRDFAALLNLIRAHALLHQASRDRDAEGRIVATIEEDYAAVRKLVVDLVGEGVETTVPAPSERPWKQSSDCERARRESPLPWQNSPESSSLTALPYREGRGVPRTVDISGT
jgi:hypothetical protein